MPKIFLIAGHGAGDPGACGNGYTEAERVRTLAQRIKALGGDNVMLGDTSRNWYADNGISTLNISKEYEILEAHLDAGDKSARGGHVIINSGFTADKYDSALAAMLQDILPGRANMIVGRNDLANPNRAAERGYGYRLVEFGFITNAEDVRIFNRRMDDIARGVLNAFGISATGNVLSQVTEGGKELMNCILVVNGDQTQYYFDGQTVHPFGTGSEKKVVKRIYKESTAGDVKEVKLTPEEFKDLKKVLGRAAK